MSNLLAAQRSWRCKCTDRENGLSEDRMNGFALYEHRKTFHTEAKSDQRKGGYRGAFRRTLTQHYSQST
eukprot:6200504-Pleurochrysis_carterae.AAC.3